MIWLSLRDALLWLVFMLIPPPAKLRAIPSIDPNAVCPACGHRQGQIRAVLNGAATVVQHQCTICQCRWYEKPILSDVLKVHGVAEVS
jgi:hypothetical protein